MEQTWQAPPFPTLDDLDVRSDPLTLHVNCARLPETETVTAWERSFIADCDARGFWGQIDVLGSGEWAGWTVTISRKG